MLLHLTGHCITSLGEMYSDSGAWECLHCLECLRCLRVPYSVYGALHEKIGCFTDHRMVTKVAWLMLVLKRLYLYKTTREVVSLLFLLFSL